MPTIVHADVILRAEKEGVITLGHTKRCDPQRPGFTSRLLSGIYQHAFIARLVVKRQLLTDYYPLYLSTWCVLLCTADVFGAAALDYGFAGDYDYTLITALVDDRSFVAELDTYDYDYGTPRAVPETAAVTTRTASNLDNNRDRRVWFQQVQPVTLSPRGDKCTQHGSH